ncbi:MAG: hypothetical protein AAB815_00270 [Patescibacteria group bacterium]
MPLSLKPIILTGTKVKKLHLPYYKKGNFTLYKGDVLDVIRRIPDNSIDMVFSDPPYNLSNGGFTVHAGKMVSVNKGGWDVGRGFENAVTLK